MSQGSRDDQWSRILRTHSPAQDIPDQEDKLQAVDTDLGECAWVMPKGAKAIDVQKGAEPVSTFQYVYLSVKSEFTPTEFWFVFAGEEHWKVTVKGRNLRPLYDAINDHKVRRISKIDREFTDEARKKPEITDILVTPKEER
jgi:hypothetical protein